MNPLTIQLKIVVAVSILLLLVGSGVAIYHLWPRPIVETAAPEVRQADHSLELQRAPNATAKPAQIIPKGAKVVRIAQVTLQGGAPVANLKLPSVSPTCPPVKLDMTLVRLPDRSQRVLASSPDGQVLGGVDIPVETAAPPEDPKKWAAGMSYDFLKQTPGLWVERDVWRARLGAEINQTRVNVGGPAGTEFRLRLGMTF